MAIIICGILCAVVGFLMGRAWERLDNHAASARVVSTLDHGNTNPATLEDGGS